jgi:SAM-dependent methyltransferase
MDLSRSCPVTDKSVGEQWIEHYKQSGGNPYANPDVLKSFFTRFIKGPYIQHIVRYAQQPTGARAIEVGCGSARFTACLAILGYDATALDVSPVILTNALDMKRQAEHYFGPLKINTLEGDLEKGLDIPDGTYDLVFNEGVVEHWLDDVERGHVFSEMARITKPGGVMAIIVPNGGHPWIDYWEKHNLAIKSAPAMTHFSTVKLRHELEQVGLQQIFTDGIYPWHTIDWGTGSRLRFLIGGSLNKTIPLPKAIREKWGIMIVGIGRKV